MPLKGQGDLSAEAEVPATSKDNVRKDLKGFWEWRNFGANIHRSWKGENCSVDNGKAN